MLIVPKRAVEGYVTGNVCGIARYRWGDGDAKKQLFWSRFPGKCFVECCVRWPQYSCTHKLVYGMWMIPFVCNLEDTMGAVRLRFS